MRTGTQYLAKTALAAIAIAALAVTARAPASEPGHDCAQAAGEAGAVTCGDHAVAYDCGEPDNIPFLAAFYPDTDPATVVLTRGQDRVTAVISRSGSGSRYTAEGVEFWEHHGEATVNWFGTELKCRVVR